MKYGWYTWVEVILKHKLREYYVAAGSQKDCLAATREKEVRLIEPAEWSFLADVSGQRRTGNQRTWTPIVPGSLKLLGGDSVRPSRRVRFQGAFGPQMDPTSGPIMRSRPQPGVDWAFHALEIVHFTMIWSKQCSFSIGSFCFTFKPF